MYTVTIEMHNLLLKYTAVYEKTDVKLRFESAPNPCFRLALPGYPGFNQYTYSCISQWNITVQYYWQMNPGRKATGLVSHYA